MSLCSYKIDILSKIIIEINVIKFKLFKKRTLFIIHFSINTKRLDFVDIYLISTQYVYDYIVYLCLQFIANRIKCY